MDTQDLQRETAAALAADGSLAQVVVDVHKKWWCCLILAQETGDPAAARLSAEFADQATAALRAVMAQAKFSGMESMPEDDQ